MTSPSGEMAGDGYRVGGTGVRALTDLNNLSEAEAKRRLRAPVEPSFNRHRDAVWDNNRSLLDIILGRYTGSVPEFVDGQLELNERLELLTDVSGYAVAYQTENYMQKGSSEFYTVRFNSRLGPQKNATVNGDGTITLAQGTWHINCLVTTDTNTNNPTGFLRIDVLYPAGDPRITPENGGVYSSKEIQQQIQGGKWNSFQNFHPVITDAPGFKVRARFRYAPPQVLKTLIRGGTELSHLAVDRKDLNSENAVVDENVPTGPDIN